MESFAGWLLSVFTVIGVGISLYFLIANFNKKTKIESAKFAFELSKRFLEEPFKTISREIGQELDGEQSFRIQDDGKKFDLFNYLGELEIISQFYLDGVLTKKQTYEVLGNQLLETFSIKLIRDTIDNERKKSNQQDLFDNLQKVWKIMYKYQSSKMNKKIQSVESLYLEVIPKKNDTASDNKTPLNSEP